MSEPDDAAAPGVSLTDLEGVRDDQLRREYWGWDPDACVVLCKRPPRRPRRAYCPGCAGKTRVEPLSAAGRVLLPERPGFLAELVTAWREGARRGDQDAVRLIDRLRMRHQEDQ
jgi:hypothetical protein